MTGPVEPPAAPIVGDLPCLPCLPCAPRQLSLRRFAAGAALLALAVGGVLYGPTFRCAWAYDDMDYLNYAAQVLAGRQGYWSSAFHPHLEHLVPLVRIAFHASLALFGVWALPFRLVVFLAHAGAAVFMALVARRYTGSTVAGWAAALAYVLPAGFSSVWIWLMTGAGVPLGLFGLTGALAALAWTGTLGRAWARGLAAAGLAVAAAAESTLVPLVLVAALFDEIERRRDGAATRRGPVGAFSLAILGGALAAMAAAAVLYRHAYGRAFALDFRRGLPRALFLLLVAPFRYLFPGQTLARSSDPPHFVPVHGCLFGLVVAAAVAALLLGLGRRFPAALVPVVAAAASGPLAILLLVGLGRAANSFGELYEADRYFFTLLLPISLLAAGITAGLRAATDGWPPLRRRALVAVLAGAVAAEAVLHFETLQQRVTFPAFAQHERRFAQLARLDAALARAARQLPPGEAPPRFPDADLHFPDVHNGYVSAALLLCGVGRGRTGVELARGPVGERDARILNPALAAWAVSIGEPLPYLSIAGGRLVDAHLHTLADFRREPGDATIVSGFYPWEGAYRWMGQRGVLRLTTAGHQVLLILGAPARQIAQRFPARPPILVRVSLTDEMTRIAVPIGTITVGPEEGDAVHVVDSRAFGSRFGNGRRVLLVLDAGPAWSPADVVPHSTDPRPLTVRVAAAGFAGAP
ncbi:MAG TPA: hypothetical protein VOA80_15695 [Thermoanaerobaculia bacterium]|nr:hypothetical protein [Thermoanaerobaculia bacterium]